MHCTKEVTGGGNWKIAAWYVLLCLATTAKRQDFGAGEGCDSGSGDCNVMQALRLCRKARAERES